MKNPDILNLMDQISQALVFGDQDQSEVLQDLPEYFGELGAMVREMGRQAEGEACQQAISLAVQVLDGSVDWAEGIGVLSRAINALQSCLADDCSADEAGFPVELVQGLAVQSVVEDSRSVEVPAVKEEAVASEHASDRDSLVDDGILGEFLSRQIDSLQDVEKHLLNVEEGQDCDEDWLLRYYHTLKGESALLGLNESVPVPRDRR